MIKVLLGGFTAACLFCAALLFGIALIAIAAPHVRDLFRKMRRHKLEAALFAAVLAEIAYYGGSKQSNIDAGADDGIVLAGVNVDYDSTNDVTAVAVLFTSGNVTVDTPVSVRNSESEEWRELVKHNAEITTDLSTNILSFTVWGNPATNRYWWVGVDTPAVIIESEGIKITRFIATSKSVNILWTCDDPRATSFEVQRRLKGSTAWETVAETSLLGYTHDGFTVGQSWEWRVIAVYPAEEAAP